MKWNEHPTLFKAYSELLELRTGTVKARAKLVYDEIIRSSGVKGQNLAMEVKAEAVWTANDRPYYDLYPGIAGAFTKVDLSKVRGDQIKLPLPQLLIRLPVGHELKHSEKAPAIRSILVSEVTMHGLEIPGWMVSTNDGSMEHFKGFSVPLHTVTGFGFIPGQSVSDVLEISRNRGRTDGDVDNAEVDLAVKVLVTLCLLRSNPDLIDPLPLEADRAKWEDTHDPKLLEKAARRGKRGWAIGKHIEVAPGFRCPHFAIRWMGTKGNYTPVLRPVKGCLVRKKAVTEVPTDWLGPAV